MGAGKGCVAGAEGKGSFRLQVVTPYQPHRCLFTLPGSLVLLGMILSQPNADLGRQLHLSQLEGCWTVDITESALILYMVLFL